jgi:predicted dehydrogenase
MKKIAARIGIVGAGIMGQLRAQSVKDHPVAELAAVMDPEMGLASRLTAGTGARACPDLEAFMDTEMDAVLVSSPAHVHEEACYAAFSKGCHVLCEKPLSNTVEGCRRILNDAGKAGAILAVGFNHRFYPAIKFVKKTIDSGAIGDLDHLRIFGGHDGLANFRAAWQYKAPESGGGAMMDVGIHMTDLARFFLGEVSEVYGISSESIWKIPGSEDNAMAIFRSPSGIAASYHATWTEWKGYRFYVEAYGHLGMVRGYYAPMQNLLVTMDKPGGKRRKKRLFYPQIMLREKLRSWRSTTLKTLQEELDEFLSLISGGTAATLADGFAGLRAVEIAAAVKRSSETSEVVHWPED